MRNHALLIIGILVGLSSGLTACSEHEEPADGCGEITVDKARVVPAHPGSREMLGYFRLENPGDKPVRINGIASGDFHHTAFQDKTRSGQSDDGPRSLTPFTLSPGQTLQLKPGKREVVLYSPSHLHRDGDKITLQLSCGKQHAKQDFYARVVDREGGLSESDDSDQGLQKALESDGNHSAGDEDMQDDSISD